MAVAAGNDLTEVKSFLETNEVMEGWKELILGDSTITTHLQDIIGKINGDGEQWTPTAGRILRAFAYCQPEGIKVIIIGSSPVTKQDEATGLSFSSNKLESQLSEHSATKIVHKALKTAEILDETYRHYYCGHEEWARNGVLLLNAALTIPKGNDVKEEIKKHCEIWRPFLVGLLKAWIEKYTQAAAGKDKIVMLWGRSHAFPGGFIADNYAQTVWEGVLAKLGVVPSNFKVLQADHPTFPPRKSNNFLKKAPKHFNNMYRNAFEIEKKPPKDIDIVVDQMNTLSI